MSILLMHRAFQPGVRYFHMDVSASAPLTCLSCLCYNLEFARFQKAIVSGSIKNNVIQQCYSHNISSRL